MIFVSNFFQEDPSKKTLITNLSVILFFNFRRQDFFFSKLVRNFQKYFSVAEKKIHAGEKFSVTFFDPRPKNRKLDQNRKRFQLDRKDTLNKKCDSEPKFGSIFLP